jgi:hypothetical protein
MKSLILATAIVGSLIPAAEAGYSCRWVLNNWVCTSDYNSGGGQTSCRWVLNNWVCR